MATALADTDAGLDGIIEKLLSVRGARPGKQVALTEMEIRSLCMRGRDVFMTQARGRVLVCARWRVHPRAPSR
jgi:serine/threonine-protein phosphatase PP1 catalytic subunit